MCYNKKHRLPFVIERQFFMDENLKKGRDQAMEEQENKLGTAPIGKLLVQMSLPAITAQVINALYNIVDRIYIGHPRSGFTCTGITGCSVSTDYDYFCICSTDWYGRRTKSRNRNGCWKEG